MLRVQGQVEVIKLTASNASFGVTVGRCKWFEFVSRSVNNLKMARHKIVNKSENGYGRINYTDC